MTVNRYSGKKHSQKNLLNFYKLTNGKRDTKKTTVHVNTQKTDVPTAKKHTNKCPRFEKCSELTKTASLRISKQRSICPDEV